MSQIKVDGSKATVIPEDDILSANRDQLRDEILKLIDDGTQFIEIDLAKVGRIDSSGLSVFIAAYNSLRSSEGTLSLTNVNENIKKLLVLTRFDRYVSISTK